MTIATFASWGVVEAGTRPCYLCSATTASSLFVVVASLVAVAAKPASSASAVGSGGPFAPLAQKVVAVALA